MIGVALPALRESLSAGTHSETALAVIILAALGSVGMAGTGVVFAISLRIKNNRVRQAWERREAVWQPIILQVLSGELAPQALYPHVRRADRVHFLEFVTRYVWHFSGHERRLLQELAHPYLGDAARDLRARDAEQRAQTVQMLGALWPERFAPELIQALADPAPLVAMSAARALAQPSMPEHAHVVLSSLDRFARWNRGFLSAMIASMGPVVAPVLREFLASSDQISRVRVVAAEALWEINDFAAADVAATVLSREWDEDVAAACLDLLGQVGTTAHLDIVRRYCMDAPPHIRTRALDALGQLGSEDDRPILEEAMNDTRPRVALAAARAVLNLEGTTALEIIAATDLPARVAAEHALAEVGE